MKNKQPTTVFVQVDVNNELPNGSRYYNCIVEPNEFNDDVTGRAFYMEANRRFFTATNEHYMKVTHWLKPLPASIVLSVEEYEKLGEAKRLLESLTPGGSEFYNDAKYCADFIRKAHFETVNSLKQIILELKEKLNTQNL